MTLWSDLVATTAGNDFFLVPAPDGSARGLKIEIGIPTTGSNIVGGAAVGTAIIEAPSWVGVTDRFIGCDVSIGTADGSNQVGTMTLALDDTSGRLSPWNNVFATVGTLVRISTLTPGLYPSLTQYPSLTLFPSDVDRWTPLFTGITESWTTNAPSIDGTREVTIVAAETTSLLARLNEKALAAVVGNGDTTAARIDRLLTAAGWPYGLQTSGATTYTHQSTDQAANRLTECYLTADSAGIQFRAQPDGSAYVGTRATTFVDIDATAVIDDGTLLISNDADLVVNTVALAIANDPAGEIEYTNAPSIARFGTRATKRDDLNLTIGTSTAAIAADILDRGNVVMRVTTFQLDSVDNFAAEVVLRTIGPNVGVSIVNIPSAPGVTCEACYVAAIQHTIRPMGPLDVQWSATVYPLPSAAS